MKLLKHIIIILNSFSIESVSVGVIANWNGWMLDPKNIWMPLAEIIGCILILVYLWFESKELQLWIKVYPVFVFVLWSAYCIYIS